MKKNNFLYINVLLIALMCSIYVNAQNSAHEQNVMKYKIIIINKYFGRVNNRTIVTEDSLSYETKIYKGNSEKTNRLLTKEEKEQMMNFLKDFPLDELKKSYVTNMVKDGTQMTFTIDINGKAKEIFIGNVYQENLGELVALIVAMLPEDFIGYRQELIYPY